MAAQADIEVPIGDELPVALFIDLMTQWRMGMAGPVGLDYTAIPAVMDLRDIPREERSELFDDLRVMESAALEQLRSTK